MSTSPCAISTGTGVRASASDASLSGSIDSRMRHSVTTSVASSPSIVSSNPSGSVRETRNAVRDSRPSLASHSSARAVRPRCAFISAGGASWLAKLAATTIPPSLLASRPARRTAPRLESPQTGTSTVFPRTASSSTAVGTRLPNALTSSGVTISDARMTTSTALIVVVSNRPSFAPTSVVASVAAACEPERPDITPISAHAKWNVRPATTAASALPPSTATVNTAATSRVFGSTITFGSSSTPTDTRKIGMNSVEPMNCNRSISGLSSGTARLSPRPAKNAPTMASMPAASAITPPTRKAATPKTKRYERSVPTRAKNQRAEARQAEQRPGPERRRGRR